MHRNTWAEAGFERCGKRNRPQSKVRAKVEPPFHVMKRVFGFTQVRYRGLAKNTHRVQVTCAWVDLFLVRKRWLRPAMV